MKSNRRINLQGTQSIIIRGAREHNLKNINLKLPRDKLIVVTGLSGSGKSSLVFDTIYAEGQRRYMESLSSYARQFLDQLQKPNVEYIQGLSPVISIEQRTARGNPRSTVGTQTEIYDYLRLLFARIGKVHCYQCGRLISRQTSQEIVTRLLELPQNNAIMILAPIIRGKKGEYRDIAKQIQKAGFIRFRADGKIYEVRDTVKLDRYRIHNIEVVVDRLTIKPQIKNRLADSIETALKVGKGIVVVSQVISQSGESRELIFSEQYACIECGISYSEVEPRVFSFNSPYGACPSCNGLGTKLEFDPDFVVPDKDKSIREGVIEPWRKGGRGYILYYRARMREFARQAGIDLDQPFKKLKSRDKKSILYGAPDIDVWGKPFEGIIPHLERLFHQTDSDYLKEEITRFMSALSCPDCGGMRLKKEARAIKLNNKNIYEVTQLTIKQSKDFFQNLKLTNQEQAIASQILKEIIQRLNFCINVGLNYLSLDRRSSTLSGGEAQRIRLATQVGSGLVGVLYALDEPSIGLHPRDNQRLLKTLTALRDLGNTLIVVEHDESTIRAADFIVDLGLGAGRHGGHVVFSGEIRDLLKHPGSLTAKYLRRELKIKAPHDRRLWRKGKFLEVKGAGEHNLKNIDVRFPIGVFTCVTGVSGSGKSTLVDEILYRGLIQKLYKTNQKPGIHKKILGNEFIDKVIVVDQSPIGRTPRSNPATYTKVFSYIRDIFSRIPQARMRGFKPGRFSFNVKGGRCEACQGDGIKKIEMHFLPDVYVPCDICKGHRFNEQTLEIKYKGKSIADVLDMTVEEAANLFSDIPRIKNILDCLNGVGLGYIQLGQSATTLSGGEAQRVKLSSELSKRSTGRTLYILDEPTTGLHFADVEKLLLVLQWLVDKGNTVIVIEHNLEVIKCADYIIDLGPEGGDAGGRVVAVGSPEDVIKAKGSHTGRFLKKFLQKSTAASIRKPA
ncbi:MAG: excinuclease ABC subunit UvrA [Candidatus Omnitrophota bacterium]